ncbi:NB-ARC and TPR domain protein [Paraphaeosphaeria sporulosa]
MSVSSLVSLRHDARWRIARTTTIMPPYHPLSYNAGVHIVDLRRLPIISMAFLRLLEPKPDGSIVFHEMTSSDVPAYAILSHTWEKEEVLYQDMEANADMSKTVSKPGWRKIEFCARQAAADGLRYFWIDTCCIDKKNAVELSAAINCMFRWYQNAARCYVYLSDVPKTDGVDREKAWEHAFRTSRWFTRGWTLQELIAPRLVDFFSSEGEQLGSKLLLETEIHKITGIAKNALRGGALSNFSIRERMAWAERRSTTVEEDAAYCLLGIFDISMPLIYGERKDQAFRRLDEEIHKLNKGIDFEQYAVRISLASFPEAAQFVAREKELSEIHELLHGHSRSSRSSVVLHGLGGIGKTQLAIEYIIRYEEKHTAIFWLNANDEDSLRLSFRDIAQQILTHHPSTGVLCNVDLEGNLDGAVSAVKAWLNLHDNTRWLMIYDNYDNPRTADYTDRSTVDLRRYLPESDQGSVIITTRSANVAQGRRLHVQKLTGLEDGLKILSNMSRRVDLNDDPEARALVAKLDGLPLALSTAGAYLEHVTTSFAEYLRLYEASWLKLQKTSPKLNSYEDRSLYTTWQVTLDRVRKQNPASAQLLKLWAYFDKQDLWFGLLRHAHSADDEWIQKLTEDEMSFNEAVRLLCEYGLAHLEPSLGQPSGSAGYDAARWWLLQQRLLQHAARHEHSITDGTADILGIEWALHNLGDLYANQGKLVEAEAMYSRALQGKEEALGPKHTSTLDTVNNLGMLYANQGKLAEAEAMYSRALQGYEEALGPKHTSTLNTVNNLGMLYANQGKLAEAETMYSQALQGREEALGPKHTSTLNTVNNLGMLYANQGKLAEAETMYSRALQGYEEALGPKHTSTLDTVNNLGALYANQGYLAEAEAMYSRALQGYEEALGPKHTSTLDTVNNLGMLYKNQGKLAEAEVMYGWALQGKEEALGPKHISTLNTVNNLGLLYANQGKLAEAEAMYSQALQGYEEALGPKHTSTLNTVNNLGLLYANQGKLAEAEAMYSWALQGYEEALGPKHTSTLHTVNNLGILYANQGKLAEAEAMYSRALQGKEEALGPKHTWTLNTVNNLGDLYADQGKLTEAETMYSRALQGYEEALGPKLLPSYLPALNTMFNFGDLLFRTGREDTAKIKPDNILVNYRHVDQEVVVEQPEEHFKGELNIPSDLYSFGLVVRAQSEQRCFIANISIYAVLGRVILWPDDDFKLHESKGALPAFIRLQRQISYFGDKEGSDGLMKRVGDEEANCEILRMLWEERAADYIPYVPFSEWTDVDSTFKDLIRRLNNLDPSQRLTARQALDYPWFEGIETAY